MLSNPTRGERQNVCFVVSSPDTVRAFLTSHIAALSHHYDVTVVGNLNLEQIPNVDAPVKISRIPIQRKISLVADVRALFKLFNLIRKESYTVVHSITPKAGLLAMIAAFLNRTPIRIHWFTGQVWATKRGFRRFTLKQFDRLTAALATTRLVDSPTQLQFLTNSGVLKADSARVLADGSVCGVDTNRFRPDPQIRRAMRSDLGIEDNKTVVLYIGRINREKGIHDLVRALGLTKDPRSIFFLIAGIDEEGLVSNSLNSLADMSIAARYFSHTENPERLMQVADIYCQPSHREGFGLSVIEAASCSVPSLVSNIYGLVDAIQAGETGLTFPVGSPDKLAQKIDYLIDHKAEARRMGQRGRKRVERKFTQARLTEALLIEYQYLVENTLRRGERD